MTIFTAQMVGILILCYKILMEFHSLQQMYADLQLLLLMDTQVTTV